MERKVTYYSDGLKIASVLFEPDQARDKSCPGIVLCQGTIGVKEYFWLPTLGRRLAELGYVALIWDYRGVGQSEGEPGRLYPLEQAEDIRNALTYLEVHPKVDPERLALAGWSFGGGMVPYVAGVDDRVRCSVSVVGWADGEGWMRDVRRDYEYQDLLEVIANDRKSRVLTGKSEPLPAENSPVSDPSANEDHARIFGSIPEMENITLTKYSLASVEKWMKFSPMSVVDRISPRAILYIVAEKDTICPPAQTIEMYERTREPKKLWLIRGAPWYAVHEDPCKEQVWDMMTDWLRVHLNLT